MAASSFDAWVTFAIGPSETDPGGEEGGFNARDPSAANPTWRGIELREWRNWRRDQSLTAQNMRDLLHRSEIGQIARAGYWAIVNGDRLPAGLDVLVNDHGFNAGPETSARLLQRMLGFIGRDVDGVIGPMTLLATKGAGPVVQTIARLRNVMEADYRADKKFPIDGKDWIGRLDRCAALATHLATARAAV